MDSMNDAPERITVLKMLAVACGIGLFTVDFILDIAAKPIPIWAYAVLGSIVAGVDAKAFRNVLMRFFNSMAGGDKE